MLRDENKYSEDNIKYRDKKDELQKDMMMAKLTSMQKSVLKKKQKMANAMGEPMNTETLVNDPLFKKIGDENNPATKEEINEFLNK